MTFRRVGRGSYVLALIGATVNLKCEMIGMKKGKTATVLNWVSAINILICTMFLIWYNRLEHLVWHDPSAVSWDILKLRGYLLDIVLPVLAVSAIFFIKTKRDMQGTVTKKEIIVAVIEWIDVLVILILSLFLICADLTGHDKSRAFYRSEELLCFVNLALGISEIFLIASNTKKPGTIKKKIITVIGPLAELNILMNSFYLLWWNTERRGPGLAEKMGMGWVLPYLVISEILIICSAIYPNKIHKSDSAAGKKIPVTEEKICSENLG